MKVSELEIKENAEGELYFNIPDDVLSRLDWKEGDEIKIPPPLSTYGFQKLSSEYFAKGAYEQYKLPYTIIRPFNCIGIGEKRAKNDFNSVDYCQFL